MASNICSFNLEELCNATIALMKDPQADLREIIPAPDFVGGGTILYDAAEMQNVLENGRGSVRVRAQWSYDKENNCIDVTQIPPTTTVEAIMDKITELVKLGKIREISDMRDETDLNGLKLTIDLKRGQDPDKLMARLFKATPLEDSFACNFNVLIAWPAQGAGRAGHSAGVDRLPRRVRAPPHLLRFARARKSACTCCRA